MAIGRGFSAPSLIVTILAIGVMAFLPSSVINLRMQESLFPLVAVTLALCAMIGRNNVSVAAFGVFVVLAALVRFTPDSYAFMILATYYLALYHLATSWKDITKYRTVIYDMICIFALINVVWIAMQASGIYLIFKPIFTGSAETGWFANRNESGAFLAICLPLFFRRKAAWGIVPMAYGIYAAKCTNGVIAAVIVSGIYGCYLICRGMHRRKVMVVVTTVVVASLLIVGGYTKYVHKGGYEDRLMAYRAAMVLMMDKPLFGWGIGQSPYLVPLWMNAEKNAVKVNAALYERVYHQQAFRSLYISKHDFHNKFEELWTHLHNEYIQWSIDAGVVGLSLLILVIASHVSLAWKHKAIVPGLSLVASLFSANAFFTFQIGRLLFLTVLVAALTTYHEEKI